MWSCPAIDHGVTIFPSGKIGPCCQIKESYLKPISELTNPNRFSDLKTSTPPEACIKCQRSEYETGHSYRKVFINKDSGAEGIQFLDIRNSNQCNLKCRYCGPHFSSQWANELANKIIPVQRYDISGYKDILLNESLHWMYFTGGEPIILPEHWEILEELSNRPDAKQISLMYNSNLTTLKYKNKNIADLWKKFKSVTVHCSIDATGRAYEFIRSGAEWSVTVENFITLKNLGINLTITPVISILNVWFLPDLVKFSIEHSIKLAPIILYGPDYLALDVIPDELQPLALEKVESLKAWYPREWKQSVDLITNNSNQEIFKHTMSHVLLLDKLRDEKLFELLPFKQLAIDQILKNHEYE